MDSAIVEDSEMQYLDFAYASSLIRTFLDNLTLYLTIRGRKYTPPFSFKVGNQTISTESVQTDVGDGYESKNQIVLIESKNSNTTNTIVRQLYYPFRKWGHYTDKEAVTLFFEKRKDMYFLWESYFINRDDYIRKNLSNHRKLKCLNYLNIKYYCANFGSNEFVTQPNP